MTDNVRSAPVIDGWVNIAQYSVDEVRAQPTLMRLVNFFGAGPELISARPLSELIDGMDEAGIDFAILSGSMLGRASGNLFAPICGDVDVTLEQCAESGGRLRTSLFVDSLEPVTRMTKMIREYAHHDAVAMVRITPSALRVMINDPRMYHLYGTCEELGLPISVNIGIYGPQSYSKYQYPLLIDDVLVDFPDLQVIGAHMGHPWEKLVIRLLMKFPNFHLMTSAYSPKYFAPELVDFMASSRGRERVMFGSDWPMLPLAKSIADARSLPLPPESLDAFLGGNLARLVKWQPVPVG